MTRIAICLTSHLRRYKECLQSLSENIFSKHDTDVFLSIWDKEPALSGYISNLQYNIDVDEITKDYQNAGAKNVIIDVQHYDENINKLPDDLKERLEDPRWYGNPYYYRHGLMCLWYKVNRCHNLRREYESTHGVAYDIVIRARTDVIFTTPLDHLEITDYINTYEDSPGYQAERFWFGPPGYMDQIAGMYNDIPILFDMDNEIIRHSHFITERYMKMKEVKYVNRRLNTAILRDGYVHY
jgi:hypothetical protein